MDKKWGAAALLLTAALLTGCGSSGGDSAEDKGGADSAKEEKHTSAPERSASSAPKGDGLDGTWRAGNKDSPFKTLTITGTKVKTTGEQSCPGELSDAGGEKPRIELHCAKPVNGREKGAVKMKPDGTKLSISWDGPDWGGYMDVFERS
ncbi:hypothetical protein ACH4LN_03560 [Streptomyces albus]|uniref:hypothetical protein n=1 Tax=Streptomyces albus TaxID=1888 RepID=UPI000691940B|nr:hypothetical protein [Streptomyces albus]